MKKQELKKGCRLKKEKINSYIQDYFSVKRTNFFYLLKKTKKWKEIFNQRESAISLTFSLFCVVFLYINYQYSNFDDFNSMLINITSIITSSLIGMLGFTISGLAILTGTITNKLVKNIDSDNKIDALIGILYSFYFIGSITGMTIIAFVFTNMFLYSQLTMFCWLLLPIGWVLSYFFTFIIFYSISLLGTCLRVFFISYKYSDENTIREKVKAKDTIEVTLLDGTIELLDASVMDKNKFIKWYETDNTKPYKITNVEGETYALNKCGIIKIKM